MKSSREQRRGRIRCLIGGGSLRRGRCVLYHGTLVGSLRLENSREVVIANPMQVRIIAPAKIKTDTSTRKSSPSFTRAVFLPEVWIPDEPTQARRRQVTRRNQIVRQRSRLKNIIQSILHSHLILSCPHADQCGASGRAWLFHQVLPEDERLAVERHLRGFDRLGEDLKVIERGRPPVQR